MIVRLTLILALVLAGAARADERPPRYDLDGHCSRLSNTQDGFSTEGMTQCLLLQSDALDSLRRVWPDTPAYIQRDCDLRARVDRDEDYLILVKCIHDQLREEQADKAETTKAKDKPKKIKPPN
jgi:hypothetical protein